MLVISYNLIFFISSDIINTQLGEIIMKVREFLNGAAKYLTEHKNALYSVKCFNYPVEYYEPELEGVICIARDDFDIEHIFQGYLCYPEEYPEFYRSRDFILCFGPQKNLDFEEILESNFDFEKHEIYGLAESQISKVRKKYIAHKKH